MDDKEKDKNLKPSSGPQPEPKTPDAINSPSDIFREIDDYQKQIEQEWETTKASYKGKIDQIMDDFLKHNEIPAPEPKAKPVNNSKPAMPEIESLVSEMKRTLDQAQKKSLLSYSGSNLSPIINVWSPTSMSVKRVGKRFIYVGIVAALLVAGWFFIYGVRAVTPLPYTHTSGILVTADKVYIADWFRKAVYVHSLRNGLPISSVESLPNQFATGFALTPKFFLSVDGFDKKIITHTLTEDHRVLDQFDPPGSAPAGLFWDGVDAWVADNNTKIIYQLRGNELTDVKKRYTFSNAVATSIQIADKRVWILDRNTRELHFYRLQEPLKLVESYDLDFFLAGGTPSGFFVDEKRVWVTTENPAQVVRISLKKLVRKTS